MDKFKVGDKVFSKEGSLGKELGTIATLSDGKVYVRLFSNHYIQDFFPEELLTESEYEQKEQAWMNQVPKDKKDWSI